MEKKIEDGITLIQLDHGPLIPSSMPLPTGLAVAALELLSEDELQQAVREGQEEYRQKVVKRLARKAR